MVTKKGNKDSVKKSVSYDIYNTETYCIKVTLDTINDDYCDLEKYLIAATIKNLPPDIQEQTEDMTFVFSSDMGAAKLITLSDTLTKEELEKKRYYIEKKLIILNAYERKKLGMRQERFMDFVAHEIAHHVLDHCKQELDGTIDGSKGTRSQEREADDLIEEWGFKRIYPKETHKKRG